MYISIYIYYLSFSLYTCTCRPISCLLYPSTSSASAPQGCCHWWGLNLDEAKSGRPQRPHGSVLDPTYGVCIVSDKKKRRRYCRFFFVTKKPGSLPTLIKSFFFLSLSLSLSPSQFSQRLRANLLIQISKSLHKSVAVDVFGVYHGPMAAMAIPHFQTQPSAPALLRRDWLHRSSPGTAPRWSWEMKPRFYSHNKILDKHIMSYNVSKSHTMPFNIKYIYTYSIPIQDLFNTYSIPIQDPFNTHSRPIQYLFNTHSRPVQYPFKTYSIPIQYPFKTCSIPIQHPHF